MFEKIVRGDEMLKAAYKEIAPHIVCRDGTTLSVQASAHHYCSPRDDFGPYTHVEVAYPTSPFPQGWDEFDCGGVYAQIPVELVREFIERHGGEA